MKLRKPITHHLEDLNLRRTFESLYQFTLRNISYGHSVNGDDQNIDGKMIEIADTGVAGTVNTVKHNLNRVPLFVDVKYKSISGDWFDSGTAWTKTQITIKFTVDHMHVRLFVH